MATNSIRLHRVLRAPPERVWRAFVEPDALVRWMPPYGYTCKIDLLEARVGGRYRMSFTHFGSGQTHAFGGEYLELVPGQRIRNTDRFDDPNLPGELQLTATFAAVSCGTDLVIVQDGLPEVLPPEMCILGWQDSLDQLARLVQLEAVP